MTYHLMNSANMPQAGNYQIKQITQSEFTKLIQEAHRTGALKTYIGYPANIEFLKRITGITFSLNRGETKLDNNDRMLIMKLPYRPADTAMKKEGTARMEFEYYLARYKIMR